MNGFLLDTSICIALFRGNRAVAHKLDEVGMQNCYVNDVVIAELLVGAYYSEHIEENMRQVNGFISKITVIPFADYIPVSADTYTVTCSTLSS